MEIFQGTEGFGSVALGKIKVLNITDRHNVKADEADAEKQIQLYEKAKARTIELLEKDQEESKLMLISDHQLEDAIIGRIINHKISAHKAIAGAGDYLEDVLSKQKDAYLQSKSNDIRDLTRILLTCLEGYNGADAYLPENCIIAVKSLTSADFLKLDKERVRGLIVENSSSNSHMAILAKAMGIPTILGCEIYPEWDGVNAVLDGGWRVLYLDPDDAIVDDMRVRLEEEDAESKRLMELKGTTSETSDGRKIALFANISSTIELNDVKEFDAEGIGLYRTEPAYVNRIEAPTEDELFYEYRQLAAHSETNTVIIRTVDLGTEKEIPFLHNDVEQNFALGIRGIRLSFKYPEIFKTQLRAILRAAVYGNLSIMFPMITNVKEFHVAREYVDECYRELISQDIPCKMIPVGVMIETPAAVMISDELSKHADFLSIGTNDLTQYTLGVDRENKELADIIDYHHPAILKMLKMVVDNGHKNHIEVGICGELASDDQLTSYFLEIGVDNLSIAPRKILPLRNKIQKM